MPARVSPTEAVRAEIGHAPWHDSGLLQRDLLAAASPIRELAKVLNVECALLGRLVAHAAGRGDLGFRLRAFDTDANPCPSSSQPTDSHDTDNSDNGWVRPQRHQAASHSPPQAREGGRCCEVVLR